MLLIVKLIKIKKKKPQENLCFSVVKTSRDKMHEKLEWLIAMIKEVGCCMPKTIIFCNTLTDIAFVFNHLLFKLGGYAYYPPNSSKKCDLIIGIFHSVSWQQNKDRVFKSFRENGHLRVVTALSMRVNFPDVRYIINWGPARTLIDQHQEAGRAGRDGEQSHVIVVYYGQQLSHCEENVSNFVKAEGCYRVAAYKTFDPNITPLDIKHKCCFNCAKSCNYKNEDCKLMPFECHYQLTTSSTESMTRLVTVQDKQDVRDALSDIKDSLPSGCTVFGSSSCHGFSEELIECITDNCHCIFTLNDVNTYLPIFTVHHGLKILEVFDEIFDDIPQFDSLSCIFNEVVLNDKEPTELQYSDSD
jgi:superfamily II DNA helicase RecQ